MSQIEIKIFTSVTIFIGAVIWLALFFINGFEVFSLNSLKAINYGITSTGFFWFVYFRWAWKWGYVRKLLYRPNINGTWLGEFKSDWKNEKGLENPPRRFVLVIRQHWFSISVRAFTNLQKTESYVEILMIDESKGIKLLAYLFSEKRVGAGDHGPRQGAAELELIEDGTMKFLEGHFWTQAGTRGYVKVKQASSIVHVASFDQAIGKWKEINSWWVLNS
ncbi:MAG: Cap15 family cyclic dinucleotide receptor domain-containing protein [Methylobacter sp.]